MLAVVRAEERPDGAVARERQECSGASVEAGDRPVVSDDLEHRAARVTVTKGLRQSKVLITADRPELAAVFDEMLIQPLKAAKTDARAADDRRGGAGPRHGDPLRAVITPAARTQAADDKDTGEKERPAPPPGANRHQRTSSMTGIMELLGTRFVMGTELQS